MRPLLSLDVGTTGGYARDPDIVKELIALNEIPAPPFKEQARAKAYLEMLRQDGLSDVEMDTAGNVMVKRTLEHDAQRKIVVAA